jgi:hypothetical protein
MATEEDIDSWFEEKKQLIMAKLVKALEDKNKVDQAEAQFTKEFNTLFEEYKKRKAKLDDELLKQKSKPSGRKKVLGLF